MDTTTTASTDQIEGRMEALVSDDPTAVLAASVASLARAVRRMEDAIETRIRVEGRAQNERDTLTRSARITEKAMDQLAAAGSVDMEKIQKEVDKEDSKGMNMGAMAESAGPHRRKY